MHLSLNMNQTFGNVKSFNNEILETVQGNQAIPKFSKYKMDHSGEWGENKSQA